MNEQHDIAQFVVRQGLLTPPEAEQALEQCQGVALLEWLQQRGWLTSHQTAGIDELRRLAFAASAPHQQQTEDAPGRPFAVVRADTSRPAALDSTQPTDPLRALFGLPEDDPPRRGRFVLEEETPRGKGGMGQVWLAHDDGLGRRVALKEMRPDLADQHEASRRFLLEAQVTSQLQHPGIVPVYEMLQSEQGPFYTMRFVEGHSLAQAIADYHRQLTPAALHDLLGAFAQVCNTLAYAHSRGVVHRDLKPANVVLGSFGEVVVLDWGLALVLARRERERPESGPAVWVDDPVMSKAAGGTPSYIAPEQARGEIERVDERADVFGLGAILCEILTGKPPYCGESSKVYRKAVEADLADAFARIDGSDADAELRALCKHCLSANPHDRPRDAGKVAEELSAYRQGVQERLRQAELARAQAEVKTQEERKRRRVQLALAGALACILALGVGGGVYRQREHELRRLEKAQRENQMAAAAATTLEKVGEMHKQERWSDAVSLLKQTRLQLGDDAPPELLARLERALTDYELLAALEAIRLKKAAWVEHQFDVIGADKAYTEVFGRYGLANGEEAVETTAARLRGSAIKEPLLAALDDWAFLTKDRKRKSRLCALLRAVDPHPWRDRLRDPAMWADKKKLQVLVDQAKADEVSPQIASALALSEKVVRVEELLRRVQRRHPADFWVNLALGNCLLNSRPEEAVVYLRVAVALRPLASSARVNLGNVLHQLGKKEEAVECWYKAIELEPANAHAYNSLGIFLTEQKKAKDAVACYLKAIQLDPNNVIPYFNLGAAHQQLGSADDAIAWYRKAITINPDFARAHAGLGHVLANKGEFDEAIACFRKALERDPSFAFAEVNLGIVLYRQRKLNEAIACWRWAIKLDPKDTLAHSNLGVALREKGRWDESIASHRRAVELSPKNATYHFGLGVALSGKGNKTDEVIACYRKAIELNPGYADAHYNLGHILYKQEKLDEASSCFRKVIHFDPRRADAHESLAQALVKQEKVDEAMACYQNLLNLDPGRAYACAGMGILLLSKGRYAEARKALTRAVTLLPESPVRASVSKHLQSCKRLLDLEKRLPGLVRDEVKPDSAQECLDLFTICRHKQMHAATVRFYRLAIALEPKLADNLSEGYRYYAASSAAMAAAGNDAAALTREERMALRRQALTCLHADLVLRRRQLQSGRSADVAQVQRTLRFWQNDPSLAGLRDAESLKKLAPEEEKACGQLWADVAAVLKKAEVRAKKEPR